eukprot:5231231-Pyramimonas_sp.AAC.1
MAQRQRVFLWGHEEKYQLRTIGSLAQLVSLCAHLDIWPSIVRAARSNALRRRPNHELRASQLCADRAM